ncbi:MAG: hypothetical protein IH600_17730 [Bacteroidetes bacterium]|nr:hypothetical protein [Bacteroidota bacterium]
MKRSILFISLMTLLAGVTLLVAQQNDLMEKKTLHAEKIFRALALGDLAQVSTEADALEKVTVDAGFANRSESYQEYGKEFLKVVRALKKEASNGNSAGSYYQFSRMSGLCFTCHEHVRDNKD